METALIDCNVGYTKIIQKYRRWQEVRLLVEQVGCEAIYKFANPL